MVLSSILRLRNRNCSHDNYFLGLAHRQYPSRAVVLAPKSGCGISEIVDIRIFVGSPPCGIIVFVDIQGRVRDTGFSGFPL